MPLAERCFYLAAARDRADMEAISYMTDKEKDNLGSALSFVRIEEEDDGRR